MYASLQPIFSKLKLFNKVIQLGGLTVTAGLLVFPVSYILNDCISEVWGFRKARLIIWSGFAMNFFVVALGLVAVALPAAPFWEGEEHFNFVFGMAPRIVLASLLAFLAQSLSVPCGLIPECLCHEPHEDSQSGEAFCLAGHYIHPCGRDG